MKIFNPIMKEVEIIPKSGGVVITGVLMTLTDYHAILLIESKQEVVSLKGKKITLTKEQKVKEIEKELTYKVTNRQMIFDVINAYEYLFNSYS